MPVAGGLVQRAASVKPPLRSTPGADPSTDLEASPAEKPGSDRLLLRLQQQASTLRVTRAKRKAKPAERIFHRVKGIRERANMRKN